LHQLYAIKIIVNVILNPTNVILNLAHVILNLAHVILNLAHVILSIAEGSMRYFASLNITIGAASAFNSP